MLTDWLMLNLEAWGWSCQRLCRFGVWQSPQMLKLC